MTAPGGGGEVALHQSDPQSPTVNGMPMPLRLVDVKCELPPIRGAGGVACMQSSISAWPIERKWERVDDSDDDIHARDSPRRDGASQGKSLGWNRVSGPIPIPEADRVMVKCRKNGVLRGQTIGICQ
jgi:hypothetical protein